MVTFMKIIIFKNPRVVRLLKYAHKIRMCFRTQRAINLPIDYREKLRER